MRTLRLTLPLLALLGACALDAPQQYLVPDLRIVAIKASANGGPSADADIDEPIRLEALLVNPLARTVLPLDWYVCLPAGGRSPCEDPDVLRDPAALATNPDVLPIGSGNPITLATLPFHDLLDAAKDALIGLATATPRLQCTLYFELPVVAVVRDDLGEVTEVALTYVRISPSAARAAFPDSYVLNMNPVLDPADPADPFEPLLMDPTDADACEVGTSVVDALTLPGGEPSTICGRTQSPPQRYCLCGEDGAPRDANGVPVPSASEELTWQWYLSAGEIAAAGFDGNVTANSIDLTPTVGAFDLWTIVRDGRGGTAWAVRSLTGLPAVPSGSGL